METDRKTERDRQREGKNGEMEAVEPRMSKRRFSLFSNIKTRT